MSIYRTLERYRRDDIHAYGRVRSQLSPGLGTPQINVESDQYQHLRKPTPVSRPLPRTLMWVADLPEDLRPIVLLRDYARIANHIVAAWGDRSCFYAYMDSLLTDHRGNRRGFPPDVLRELEALRRYYDVNDQDSPWDTVTKRG